MQIFENESFDGKEKFPFFGGNLIMHSSLLNQIKIALNVHDEVYLT